MTLDQARARGQLEADLHGLPIQIVKDRYSENDTPYEYAPDHAVKYLFRDAEVVETLTPE